MLNKIGLKQAIFIMISLAILYIVAPVLLVLALFAALDILFAYLAGRIIETGIDFISIGSIIVTYYYDYRLALLFIPLFLMNRIILGTLRIKHFFKLIFMILTIATIMLLKSNNILVAGVIALSLRYMAEIITSISFFETSSIFEKIQHLFVSLLVLYLIFA